MTSRWFAAQNSSDGRYGFDHATFDELRRKRAEHDEYVSKPYEVEEGVVECPRCGGKRVYSVSVQTRAADEPMSVRAYCVKDGCKYRWTQNS